MLIEEEMQQVIEYCQWWARWWAESATIRGGKVDDKLLEELQSYAAESWAKAGLSQVSATHTAFMGLLSIKIEINNDYNIEFGDDDNDNN
ncbi:hypothetical protein CY34DRAFT_18775 [Suillus luteus UH-Slu-Lm8-n1]|uniref:Uncharacterized protein n=1 Tax=Suillus luteus UH-Slu-Lm8-n1 TaxID=930992 RepID=A0A0D0A3L9_9AGAM|nr:hypothetical protein CY34DRAFT_18775 [Suillus luteus UH-Slu-Lm8-n1]